MFILSIETSGKVCSVSLINSVETPMNCDIDVIDEYNIFTGSKHDKYCAELCRRLLSNNNVSIANLAAVAVSIGPGSFTGLRIGSAIAKGIAFNSYDITKNNYQSAESPKLIAVPTLSALANNAINYVNCSKIASNRQSNDFKVLAIIPSHSNIAYYQLFDANYKQQSGIEFADLETIKNKYCQQPNLFITTNYPSNIDFGIYFTSLSYIKSIYIGQLAVKMFMNNEFVSAVDLVPTYLQEFKVVNKTKTIN